MDEEDELLTSQQAIRSVWRLLKATCIGPTGKGEGLIIVSIVGFWAGKLGLQF